MAKRVLSLGQCAADHYGIAKVIAMHFDAEVVAAATPSQALTELRRGLFDLVLVNRILDADGSSGLAFVEQLRTERLEPRPPVMLVSNHADAQRQALTRGALQGFGKAALTDPETIDLLKAVLE